jgi:hypothetical protein
MAALGQRNMAAGAIGGVEGGMAVFGVHGMPEVVPRVG